MTPITLEGRHVRLVPLDHEHHAALCEVGLDPDLWRWTGRRIDTPQEMRTYITNAMARCVAGTALPFAIVAKADERVVGSTRFGNIDEVNRRVEIGWTWIAKGWQRTTLNTEAKYVLLSHAFEAWDCVRVEFKTDALNEPSRRAILRIGATEEGTLRQHMVVADGRLRDSVYSSILDREWGEVKERLESLLGRGD